MKALAEDNDNSVVVDYLWDNSQQADWSKLHNEHISNNGGDLGSITANWMEENSAEATCASVGVQIPVSEGSPTIQAEVHRVLDYGWNNQPFRFNSRAGG